MGCDIHSHLERRRPDGTWELIPKRYPFDDRSYNRYAFLAGVRNYSKVEPIAEPRGLPGDTAHDTLNNFLLWGDDAHSISWLTLDELEAYDYDNVMVHDTRRDYQCTLREFLGEGFFYELADARAAGGERIVFWFDN